RMAGLGLPAMSCATSGNVGITASLPLKVVAETLNSKEEELIRSLALSFLLTIYMKSHIGRLSALCACAVAASVGIAAGSVMLLGGGLEQAEMAINSVIGSIGGVICDGAKLGCALKLSNAAGIAIESAQLAMKGISIPSYDGIVCDSADKTMEMIGKIAQEGMERTDWTMCELIIDREKNR
nr:L-serine ammonia-lyase, iron-sulfur-dependent, subunit alpha [Synergistales bacterium]